MKGAWADDEVSSIADTGDLGFLDYDLDKSVCSYNPSAEGPIIVSIPFPCLNDKPQSFLVGDFVSEKMTITNTTNEPIDLWKINIYDSNPKESFTLSLMKPPSEKSDKEYTNGFYETFGLEDRVLQPQQTLNVWLICKPKCTGLHTTAVHFDVDGNVIERLVFIMVDDKISRSLVSNKPYRRERKNKQLVEDKSALDTYVPTARPLGDMKRSGYRFQLSAFPIQKEVREAIRSGQIPDAITYGLMKENYKLFFSTLLNMEEIALEEEMRSYDMECVPFGRQGISLTLEVPGLAEKRPSLVYGDCVFAKLASDDYYATRPYQGFIHRVEAEQVHLQFNRDFHSRHVFSNLYSVQFTYDRRNMRKLYHAIGETDQLETDFLFPGDTAYKRRIRPTQLGPISDMLNEEQRLSVKMITGCRGGPPFIIHGPPGTGKTVTIVESVIQLYRGRRDTRLLICAPSNSAADIILEMLLERLGEGANNADILRHNASTRVLEDIKPEYLRFCYIEDSCFTCPGPRELSRYRIIISTYMSSYSVYAGNLGRGFFSHIFLDEAGQASEPETMLPLSPLCTRGTVVVLAGDPCQLGPVIFSKDAEYNGLSMSFLARLFDSECYYGGNENYVAKLVRNYRCHPEILFLPSQLFYGNELIAERTEDVSTMVWADLLPNKEFPLLFIGIQGCDEREGNNPSWFNRIEVSKVVEMVSTLIDEKGMNGEDIGVITPYRQQVMKISSVLESLGCTGVKVGSVEQFQGQERPVIIVSTVRSTVKHNEFDKIHYLGFLSNSRRFNVAITRARSLLIIIGNPHIIGKDKYWNLLLWHCVDNGSYLGCPLPERETFVEEDPTQEGDQWDYGGQDIHESSNTQQYLPYYYGIPQRSDGYECGDLPDIGTTSQGSNSNECVDLPWDKDNPKGSDGVVSGGGRPLGGFREDIIWK